MNFNQCPLCGSSAIQRKHGRYRFAVKDKHVTSPVIQYWACPACGETFFDREANKKIDEALLARSKKRAHSAIHAVASRDRGSAVSSGLGMGREEAGKHVLASLRK